MPSFNNHSRNYTYPPQVHLLQLGFPPSSLADPTDLPDIDEDPFAHFLSPITEEEDPYDAYDFNAGIITSDTPIFAKEHRFRMTVAKKWNQYVSRYHTPLSEGQHQQPSLRRNSSLPRLEEAEEDGDLALLEQDPPRSDSPIQVVDTPASKRPHYNVELRVPSSPMPPPREPSLGRVQDLLASPRHRRSKRSRRLLSGKRHSWREPSLDLFTVLEEPEPNENGDEATLEADSGGGGLRSQTERDGVWWTQGRAV